MPVDFRWPVALCHGGMRIMDKLLLGMHILLERTCVYPASSHKPTWILNLSVQKVASEKSFVNLWSTITTIVGIGDYEFSHIHIIHQSRFYRSIQHLFRHGISFISEIVLMLDLPIKIFAYINHR